MEHAAEAAGYPKSGRKPVTTRANLSHTALELFQLRGFDNVTVDDIAAAAGIGRRTFFRYFASKNDLPWGDFESLLTGMRAFLRELPAELPLGAGLCLAVVEFNRLPPEEIPYHRQRMELLLHVPTLLAHSTLRYAAWRQVVAEHVAHKLGAAADSLKPQATAWSLLGLCMAAYEQWLADEDADLTVLLLDALQLVTKGLDEVP